MIYYYSGTGNTRYAARQLATMLGSGLHCITAEGEVPMPAIGESVGFMFPIYSWGVPPVMTTFIRSLGAESLRGRYLWGVCTCGDEAGIAMRLFSRQISRLRGSAPEALFSLIMPNDYVLLPGFDVDTAEVAAAKLTAAPERLWQISGTIGERRTGVMDVHEGSWPALRTRLVFPLFRKWGVNPGRWQVSQACVSCGRCARVCPVGNIVMKGTPAHPVWGKHCQSCCACFHICPARAIDYGTFTRGKGQYYHPCEKKLIK